MGEVVIARYPVVATQLLTKCKMFGGHGALVCGSVSREAKGWAVQERLSEYSLKLAIKPLVHFCHVSGLERAAHATSSTDCHG